MNKEVKINEAEGTITTLNTWGMLYSYKIAKTVPAFYQVWNIADNMGTPDYIPFCVASSNTYTVNASTLIAVKLPREDVAILRKVAGKCTTNIKALKQTAKQPRKMHRLGLTTELVEKAISILEPITA